MGTPNQMLVALMEEYRRAAIDLKILLEMLSVEEYNAIRDTSTSDKDCRSIRTVCRHLVQSGYTYANHLNSVNGTPWSKYEWEIQEPQTAIREIDTMLNFTDSVIRTLWDRGAKEIESWKFETRWGVTYDIEQLLEHAIVHVLRHRRQIERFIA